MQQDFGAWSPGGKFWRMRQETDRLLYDEIAMRRERPDPERTGILNLLLAARDEHGQAMTNEELRDELVTLLLQDMKPRQLPSVGRCTEFIACQK